MKRKILIIVGTRPNFIKITQFEKEFAKYPNDFEYILLHTGQHYDDNMSKLFFDQLKLKKPDIYLNLEGLTPVELIGQLILKLNEVIKKIQPEMMMVVGDVNSTLAGAISANKTGTKLAHLESGLRSNDRKMPEEHNRIITDFLSDHLFVTEQSGLDNLKKDREPDANIHFVGNTMIDTLVAFEKEIEAATILEDLKVERKEFAVMTMHRPSNVDDKQGLKKLIEIVEFITKARTLVFPIHPRTKNNLEKFGLFDKLNANPKLKLTPPLGYLEFQKLIANSKFVLTDSGGIQEETTFRQVPCLTLRENTERPSTLELGTNKLLPYKVEALKPEIENIENGTFKNGSVPPLWDGKATNRIVKILKEVV